MKILYISDELPYPLTTGIATRSYNLLTRLAKRHEITIVSLTTGQRVAPETLEALKVWTGGVEVFGLPNDSEPAFIRAAARVPRIGRRLQSQLRLRWSAQKMNEALPLLMKSADCDVVVFCGKWTTPCLTSLRHVPVVIDCCDAEYARIGAEIGWARPLRRPWLLLRYHELKRIEERLAAFTSNICFTSMRDRNALMRGQQGGEIIPVGIDCTRFRKTKPSLPHTIVFVGVMDFSPNHDAALVLGERVLPRIRRVQPDAKVVIVGRNPRPELIRRARLWENFTVVGAVEDVREYLDQATVFAAPIRFASGTQNKVLEAMAMEVPVVTTFTVAEGLRVNAHVPLPLRVADDMEVFADEVIKLLRSPQERETLGREGRAFVQRYFEWEESARKLENLCMKAAGFPRTRAA
jgi:hypothetical protein